MGQPTPTGCGAPLSLPHCWVCCFSGSSRQRNVWRCAGSRSFGASLDRSRDRSMTLRTLPPLVVLLVSIGAWQVGAIHALLRLRAFQLPYPLDIAQAMLDRSDVLWRDALQFTAPEAAAGLIIGSCLGFACAVLFVHVPFLRRGALPIAASLNSIPIIAVSPIAVLWLGFGQP